MKPTSLVTAIGVVVSSGCYTTSAIAPAQITTIAKPLSAPADLPGAVRLGPRTEVRARLQRGWVTTWYSAGDLAVGEDGLVTGRRYRLAWADRAILSGTDAAAAAVLAATAPPEATIAPTGGGHMLLVVSQRRFLLPWIAAYASAVGTRGAQAGMLSFHSAGGGDGGDDRAWWSAPVPAASFAGATPRRLAEIQIAEGVPWRNVTELELQNLSPIKTTAVIIGTPFAVAAVVAAVVTLHGGGNWGVEEDRHPVHSVAPDPVAQVTEEVATTADAEADGNGLPVNGRLRQPAVLVAPDDAAAADLRATPLFSPSARRRDVVKLLLEGEAGVNSAANAYTARAGAGLRLCDFVELTARASPQPFNGAQHLLYGGRIGLHIDGDGDPLTAFAVGGELVGRAFDGGSLMQLGLVVGPRLGIGDRLFASALLSPSLVWWKGFADRGDGYAGQLLITVELGVGL